MPGTLRRQIEAIHARTGVNREAPLVALRTALDLQPIRRKPAPLLA
ncbi:hypothetical protein [Sphingomonas aracearum]|nr:hypothetical protein [Sphingomonas aracearum]